MTYSKPGRRRLRDNTIGKDSALAGDETDNKSEIADCFQLQGSPSNCLCPTYARTNITFSTVMSFSGCSDFTGGCHANRAMEPAAFQLPALGGKARGELCATPLPLEQLTANPAAWTSFRAMFLPPTSRQLLLPSLSWGSSESNPGTCCHSSTSQPNPAVMPCRHIGATRTQRITGE